MRRDFITRTKMSLVAA